MTFPPLTRERSRSYEILDAIPTPVYVWRRIEDGSIRLVEGNAAAMLATQGRLAALLGVELREFLPDEPSVVRGILDTLHDGAPRRLEHEYRMRTTGALRWRCTSYMRSGITDVVVHTEDATTRHEDEARLEESEARFRGVFEQGSIAMSLTAFDGRFLKVNAAFCDLVGYSEAALLETTFMALTHPDDLAVDVARKEQFAGKQISEYRIDKRFVRADGCIVWADLSVRVIRNAAGEPLYLLAQMQDITKRKLGEALHARDLAAQMASEAALRASQERHELVLKATNDVIYDWDVLVGTCFFSDALMTAFGHPRDGVRHDLAWWEEQIHPDDRRHTLGSLETSIHGAAEFWSSEYRFRRGDGRYATVLDRGHIIRRGDGAPARMIGSMTDVTERRQLEAQLRESQKMEAVGRLAGGVAHDFNNLLCAILGYADLALMDARESSTVRDEIEEIRKAAQRAAQLTKQLLAFGRRQIRRPTRIDVDDVVRDTDRLLTQLLGAHIQLLTQPLAAGAVVHMDPSELDQILVNLAVNARDAMPHGGTVSIETARSSLPGATPAAGVTDCVLLTVTDSGCGIDAETLPHIFEPFFTTKGDAGTGLGLSTVYGIVKQNGGQIEVESTVGGGTRFRVYLPASARGVTDAPTPTHATPTSVNTATVLLAEDESGVRMLARRIMERAGFTVLEARHGADALLLWRQHADEIDVVVTDLVMPEMGGRALAEALRESDPDLPVLFMSGYSDDEVTRRGVTDARIAFLAKPFTANSLVEALREALRPRV